MTKHIIMVLADGFEETEAIAPLDLLRRADIQVTLLALDKVMVTGAHGIILEADGLLTDIPKDYDGIVLPGGQPGTTNLSNSKLLLTHLQQAFKAGKLCAAICAAPSVLDKAGILNGKKATCYPGTVLQGAETIDEPVVTDGTVITGRAVGSAIPFGLALIAYLTDQATADTIAGKIVYNN